MSEIEDDSPEKPNTDILQGPGATQEPSPTRPEPTKEQREGACAQAIAEVLKQFGCRIVTRLTTESVGDDGSGRTLLSTQIRVAAV